MVHGFGRASAGPGAIPNTPDTDFLGFMRKLGERLTPAASPSRISKIFACSSMFQSQYPGLKRAVVDSRLSERARSNLFWH
jgi:hypothetical protein